MTTLGFWDIRGCDNRGRYADFVSPHFFYLLIPFFQLAIFTSGAIPTLSRHYLPEANTQRHKNDCFLPFDKEKKLQTKPPAIQFDTETLPFLCLADLKEQFNSTVFMHSQLTSRRVKKDVYDISDVPITTNMSIFTLLNDNTKLKKRLNEEMMEFVIGKIESSKPAHAVVDYLKLTISRDVSLPAILKRVFVPGDNDRAAQIAKFIGILPYIEDQIIASSAWHGLLKTRNQFTSPSVLILHYLLNNVKKQKKFPEIVGSLRILTQNLQDSVGIQTKLLIYKMVNNIKNGDNTETIEFSSGANTNTYFIPYVDIFIKAAYKDLSSVDQILLFLRSIATIYPTIQMFTSLVKVMKARGELYNRKGLDVVYTISEWSNVESNAWLDFQIPPSLKLFGGKHCVFSSLDKNNEFLTASSEIGPSGERRLVEMHPNYMSKEENAKWILLSYDWGKSFEILNVQYKEYLFAAADKHYGHRRKVFTWVPGKRVNTGFWNLEPHYEGGKFKVRNIFHRERLYAAIDMFRHYNKFRMVFTRAHPLGDHEYWTINCI